MSRLTHRLCWQVLPLTILLLLTQQTEGAKKDKALRSKKCPDCIQVRVNNKINPQEYTNTIRNFPERSIVPFRYNKTSNSNQIPRVISGVICSKTCVGHEHDMNVVPIQRTLLYLRREKNIYVLDEINVVVGCTCVFPEVREQLVVQIANGDS